MLQKAKPFGQPGSLYFVAGTLFGLLSCCVGLRWISQMDREEAPKEFRMIWEGSCGSTVSADWMTAFVCSESKSWKLD